MTLRHIRHLGGDERGAVSSMYAVAILTLVAMAGIGFDYGRMMALDTELQNAADQAALAAATQLDGNDDAMIRARDAATNAFATAASPYVNETRFANDGAGRPITSLSFKFYDGYLNDAPGTELTSDADGADAEVVEETVNTRTVNYALTPLIGRTEEIELLQRRWQRARRGDGQVVLFSGEPGVGKSRLIAAVQERIEGERHMRLRYFCSPYHQDSALHPVIAQL